MSILKNRYEFMAYLACVDCNPNGDPDQGNTPRVDPATMLGYITDGALKRRVRDYVALSRGGQPGMDIYVQSETNLNRITAETKEAAGVDVEDKTKPTVEKSRAKACEKFFDVRSFGAVMSTGPNGGQVLGPVQLAFAKSVDPVSPQDISITRVACADNVKGAKTAEDYRAAENNMPSDKLRTIGRKQFIPFGLYEIRGFVSANMAAKTGFTEEDLAVLFEAIANMYDALRTSSKNGMYMVSPVIVFKHEGDASCPADEQAHQALLGRAPAHVLFDLVDCHKKDGVANAVSYKDYVCDIALSKKPDGVRIGFVQPYVDGITWDAIPAGFDWMTSH